ncbi:hypothetical protein F4678DRAFT_463272 [Xylaria arbuscula]|nr:hypothetical protein F4678DRAFT_463272 [Xylaria arbuscula]
MAELSKVIKPLEADGVRDGDNVNDDDLEIYKKKVCIDDKTEDPEYGKAEGTETKDWFDGCLAGFSRSVTENIEDELSRLDSNIRALQKEVRRLVLVSESVLLVLYAPSELPAGTKAGDLLRGGLLSDIERRQIASRLSKDLSVGHLINLTRQMEQKKYVEKSWQDAIDSELKVPPHVVGAVKQTKEDDDRFKLENRLLKCIVDPSSIGEGWKDIEIELDTRHRVMRTMAFNLCGNSSNSTGLLKSAKIGGALIYGPPGTGKTHLARVLAKASDTAMIHMSPADVVSKWVGETEKYIKALYNLGRMIWPCIIFIDYAESLLRSRRKLKESWQVDQINQLLSEVDGLNQASKTPFLILATNHPQRIDHGMLRRVLGRIYMGLPSKQDRESLFRLFLRHERPEPIVDHKILAVRTHMSTGADIWNLCGLAAQACVDVSANIENGAIGDTNVLTMSYFEEAFHACGPTGLKEDLKDIYSFAKQYDPSSVPAISAAMKQRMRSQPSAAHDLKIPSWSHPRNGHQRHEQLSASMLPPCSSPPQPPLYTAVLEENIEAESASMNDTADKQSIETTPPGNTAKASIFEPETKHPSGAGSYIDMYAEARLNATTADTRESNPSVPSSDTSSETDSTISLARSDTDDVSKPPKSIYLELSKRDPEIRLLEIIQVGNSASRTRCLLYVVRLSEAAPFMTLSYVWGDASITEEIVLNNTSLDRPKSLGNALRVAQYHWSHLFPDRHISELRIWIDSLCINQSDIAERNHQVKLMRQIYSMTELVIGHLATDYRLARLGIATLKAVY